jgi:hypothetical protein
MQKYDVILKPPRKITKILLKNDNFFPFCEKKAQKKPREISFGLFCLSEGVMSFLVASVYAY